MSQRVWALVMIGFNVVLGLLASNFEQIFPGAIPVLDDAACYDATREFQVMFGSAVLLFGALAVVMSYFYAKRLLPYVFANGVSREKADGWRHILPILWMWNLFAALLSIYRIFKLSACPSDTAPAFTEFMMYRIPYITWVAPALCGAVAMYAVYVGVGMLSRLVSWRGVIK